MSKIINPQILTLMLKQNIELISSNTESQLICGVNNKNNSFRFSIVRFPQTSILALTAHVKHCEVNFWFWECLNFEANSCSKFVLLILLGFKKLIIVDLPELSRPTMIIFDLLLFFYEFPIFLIILKLTNSRFWFFFLKFFVRKVLVHFSIKLIRRIWSEFWLR